MGKINVSIIGASGYTGGELLRLLISHPNINIQQITSSSYYGKFAHKAHPNLRKATNLKFCAVDELEKTDLLFLCTPHGESMKKMNEFINIADKIIDLSGDFRLNDVKEFEKWYKQTHVNPELLNKFVYGIPELHRDEMKDAKYISSAGCNATTTILGLYPLYKNGLVEIDRTVVEVKVGTSEGGKKSSFATHHPERTGSLRSYKPTGHRHAAEIIQELSFNEKIQIHFSATSTDMVRGTLATSHVFLKEDLTEKDIWQIYRQAYGDEPFIRIIKEKEGNYRYPDPKLCIGTNYCDIGFERDPYSNRLVVISAIDNLMKGAAGQALQAFNIMFGFDETLGLEFTGLYPI
ncbi:MAG: N-acetyl-gamma-glutamyl-phosphate reductase [Bacteroidetes bacterium]|nr:N-acetyl-gamma-glutamyl-phosphate reductase [Bacteroidota bacterium]MBU1799486.1 N-acetyl-gamma-glutamyl-phosphate reductase [Bacteroidota bacterium]